MSKAIQNLKEDYKRIIGEEACFLKIFFKRKASSALHFLFWFRVKQNGGGHLCGKILRHVGIKYGFDIPPQTKIGGGFSISHYGMVIINPQTVIGENCHITGGVIIGKKHGKSPCIGDNVSIGANATIIGGVKIGNNSVIGAGAVVVSDVPDNAVVAGNPAKVIKYKAE